ELVGLPLCHRALRSLLLYGARGIEKYILEIARVTGCILKLDAQARQHHERIAHLPVVREVENGALQTPHVFRYAFSGAPKHLPDVLQVAQLSCGDVIRTRVVAELTRYATRLQHRVSDSFDGFEHDGNHGGALDETGETGAHALQRFADIFVHRLRRVVN